METLYIQDPSGTIRQSTLVTQGEAAAMLRVSEQDIANLANAGDLPSAVWGSTGRMFDIREVQKHAELRAREAAKAKPELRQEIKLKVFPPAGEHPTMLHPIEGVPLRVEPDGSFMVDMNEYRRLMRNRWREDREANAKATAGMTFKTEI